MTAPPLHHAIAELMIDLRREADAYEDSARENGWDETSEVEDPQMEQVQARREIAERIERVLSEAELLDTVSSASRQHYIDTGSFLAEGMAL